MKRGTKWVEYLLALMAICGYRGIFIIKEVIDFIREIYGAGTDLEQDA